MRFLLSCNRLAALVLLLVVVTPAHAWERFVVEDIRIEGADRVATGTVLNYLPVREGEEFAPRDAGRAIRTLYDTELFDDVELAREGDVLVVRVQERPAIGELNISGSFEMDEEQLREMLSGIGLERGRIYNQALLDQVEQELRQMLLGRGKYAMEFDTEVRELDENRVAIDLTLNEGRTARIRQVNIIGNEAFSASRLKGLMDSGVRGRLAFLSSRDEYSRTRLEGDLEEIRSWYLDRGYLEFAITSSQVTLTPDKRDIYITLNLEEGEQFNIRDVTVGGDIPVDREGLEDYVEVESGQLFSRADIVESQEGMSDWLAASGYAFANINVETDVDEDSREVDVHFFVEPGRRAYVRRVNFRGHNDTRDEVYRREMRQIEGSRYSPQQVDRSRVRIQRLPQVAQVSVDTDRVSEDEVDVNFDIREQQTGSLSFGAGYSSSQGVIFNIGLEQRNVLGTGRDLNLQLDNSESSNQAEVRYRNPYYTEHGVSRTLRARYRETDPRRVSALANFFTDSALLGVDYGIPLSEFNTLSLGFAGEGTRVRTTDRTPEAIEDEVDEFGDEYGVFELNVGFRRDTRNRTIFPTRGQSNRISLEAAAPGSDAEYYRSRFNHESYFPLTDRLTASIAGEVAYGSGYGEREDMPFFKRYFAGGIRSVRGYEQSSLGETFGDRPDRAKGGDLRTTGSLELIFPPPFVEEPGGTRLSVFYDFGNVFPSSDDFEASELRTSAGASFNWRSPVGPLSFSYAVPLNDQPGDRTESFQFTIGTMF